MKTHIQPLSGRLLLGHLDTLPQAFDHQLFVREAAVDIPDIGGSRLKVATGVVALRNKDLILGP